MPFLKLLRKYLALACVCLPFGRALRKFSLETAACWGPKRKIGGSKPKWKPKGAAVTILWRFCPKRRVWLLFEIPYSYSVFLWPGLTPPYQPLTSSKRSSHLSFVFRDVVGAAGFLVLEGILCIILFSQNPSTYREQTPTSLNHFQCAHRHQTLFQHLFITHQGAQVRVWSNLRGYYSACNTTTSLQEHHLYLHISKTSLPRRILCLHGLLTCWHLLSIFWCIKLVSQGSCFQRLCRFIMIGGDYGNISFQLQNDLQVKPPSRFGNLFLHQGHLSCFRKRFHPGLFRNNVSISASH